MTEGAQPCDEAAVASTPPPNDANDANNASTHQNELNIELLHSVISTDIQNKLLTIESLWSADEIIELNKLSDHSAEQQRGRIIGLLTDKCATDGADRLCVTLRETGMGDVADHLQKITSSKASDGTMSTHSQQSAIKKPPLSYKQVIRETRSTLLDCLIISHAVLDHLQKTSVISHEMVSMILCRPNRPEQNKLLIGMLADLGPKSLHEFVFALRITHQDFLANILDSYNFEC